MVTENHFQYHEPQTAARSRFPWHQPRTPATIIAILADDDQTLVCNRKAESDKVNFSAHP
jgi:hypothetical protein